MKLTDFVVKFLINKKIKHVFGYPGGMITHFMDSFEKYKDKIVMHSNYHEQASAFAACGYAQDSLKPGIAFATSGPGVTNLMTGICNAYFDSIPCIFFTGQVNTYESKTDLKVRQKGFQEMEVLSMVKTVTKKAFYISSEKEFPKILYDAYCLAISGRPGPVVLDIPMNIQRAEIDEELANFYINKELELINEYENIFDIQKIKKIIENSKRPIILAGAGIKQSGNLEKFRKFVNKIKMPIVTSMIAIDLLEKENEFNFGFIGAYGSRTSNFIISKSDLIISIGSRLDCRQTGSNLTNFASNAKLIRVDIDSGEMTNRIKQNEIQWNTDLKIFFNEIENINFESLENKLNCWNKVCHQISKSLKGIDKLVTNEIIHRISEKFPKNCIITTDVGQNQVWVAQSLQNKSGQKIFFSGGHGAMGYSLPAAIGAYYSSELPIICVTGDGGFQMNIQELEFLRREKIPIKILLINNHSLGMIRHFQEMYFNSNFALTLENNGYSTPNFSKIARAYSINYKKVENLIDINKEIEELLSNNEPQLIELNFSDYTYVYPKLAINKPINDQEPPLDRELYEKLLKL